MRLLVDANLSPAVAGHLRARGHDVTRVGDTIALNAPDEFVIAEATRLQAVIVSQDQDFSQLLALSGAIAPSLLNVRIGSVSAIELASAIDAAVGAVCADLTAGAIATVDDGGIRVRRLPVE